MSLKPTNFCIENCVKATECVAYVKENTEALTTQVNTLSVLVIILAVTLTWVIVNKIRKKEKE